MFIFKVTEPIPLKDSPACAKRAAYPDSPPVVPNPESLAAQAAYPYGLQAQRYCPFPQIDSPRQRACAVPMAMGCSISAEACAMTGAGSGACTGDSALCCADTPCSTSRGAAAAAVRSCDFGTPTSAIAQCVPEEAPPPASPGTSDADTVSTVFWRFCGGPCTGSEAKAPASSSPPPVVCARQSLQLVLWRWCWQMLAPPHSLHLLLMRWCWQMLAPPHSLHLSLRRRCWQMLAPPHSLHQ